MLSTYLSVIHIAQSDRSSSHALRSILLEWMSTRYFIVCRIPENDGVVIKEINMNA